MGQMLNTIAEFDLRNCLREQLLSLLRIGDLQSIPDHFYSLLLKMFLERMDDGVEQVLPLGALALPL